MSSYELYEEEQKKLAMKKNRAGKVSGTRYRALSKGHAAPEEQLPIGILLTPRIVSGLPNDAETAWEWLKALA